MSKKVYSKGTTSDVTKSTGAKEEELPKTVEGATSPDLVPEGDTTAPQDSLQAVGKVIVPGSGTGTTSSSNTTTTTSTKK